MEHSIRGNWKIAKMEGETSIFSSLNTMPICILTYFLSWVFLHRCVLCRCSPRVCALHRVHPVHYALSISMLLHNLHNRILMTELYFTKWLYCSYATFTCIVKHGSYFFLKQTIWNRFQAVHFQGNLNPASLHMSVSLWGQRSRYSPSLHLALLPSAGPHQDIKKKNKNKPCLYENESEIKTSVP